MSLKCIETMENYMYCIAAKHIVTPLLVIYQLEYGQHLNFH